MNYPSKWREVHLRQCGRYRVEVVDTLLSGQRSYVAQYLASQKQQAWIDIAIKDGLSQAIAACSDHIAQTQQTHATATHNAQEPR